MTQSKNLNHSKIKNSGILFEVLVRKITVDTLENKTNSPALDMMRKYFKPTTEMGKELQLYRAFFEMGSLTEVKAAQFVDFISQQRKKINERKLLQEKYEFIKELKNNYDLKSVLNIQIPSYKIYASIYKTFLSETKNFDISNIQDVAVSRFALIEHLMKNKSKKTPANEATILETFKNQTEDLRLLSYKLLLDKFNDKYKDLNDKQKQLLREYINSVSDTNTLTEYITTEVDTLKKEIASLAKSEKDKVLNIKLNEVAHQLDTMKTKKKIRDNDLTAMMIAYQIVDELKA